MRPMINGAKSNDICSICGDRIDIFASMDYYNKGVRYTAHTTCVEKWLPVNYPSPIIT